MNILENYLIELDFEDSDLFGLLSKFEKIVIFKKSKDIEEGLLKYKSISPDTAFLFKMPEEKVLIFHTVKMQFSIDIWFFDHNGKVVSKYKNLKPGIEKVSSKFPASYVIEVLSGGKKWF
jgi:uncharacterized membrane protein (UPF0127 family)